MAGNLHRQLAAVRQPSLEVTVTQLAPGQEAKAPNGLRNEGDATAGPKYLRFTTFSFIAQYVEVCVDPRTRRVRVLRVVNITDCGRVVSAHAPASQVHRGVVWCGVVWCGPSAQRCASARKSSRVMPAGSTSSLLTTSCRKRLS